MATEGQTIPELEIGDGEKNDEIHDCAESIEGNAEEFCPTVTRNSADDNAFDLNVGTPVVEGVGEGRVPGGTEVPISAAISLQYLLPF